MPKYEDSIEETDVLDEDGIEEETDGVVTDDEDELDEATSASSTLTPGGGSGGGDSRTVLVNKLMSFVAGMKKEDLSAFLTKTLAQVGHEEDPAPAAAGKNKSSVSGSGAGKPAPTTGFKKAVKEDLDELFAEDDDLSEEFKTRLATIFEAAVNNRVDLEIVRIEEELEELASQKLVEEIEEMHENVDEYLTYAAKEWIDENRIAIEEGFKAEIVENFLQGMKNLFAENYVEVPEDKIDIIEELTAKVEELEETLNAKINENLELTGIIESAEMEVAFDDVSEDLTETQKDRLRVLSENIDFKDSEDFAKKLGMIKEQYFSETNDDDSSTGIIVEEADGVDPDADEDVRTVTEMNPYVAAISRTTKR